MAHDSEYGEHRPTGNGGNSTITNQDEAEILKRCTQVPTRTEGQQ